MNLIWEISWHLGKVLFEMGLIRDSLEKVMKLIRKFLIGHKKGFYSIKENTRKIPH
jgi:hypothetical protein